MSGTTDAITRKTSITLLTEDLSREFQVGKKHDHATVLNETPGSRRRA